MRNVVYIVGIVFCISLVSACVEDTPVEELIQEEVSIKIKKYKNKKREECRNSILEEAGAEVDSTMYLQIGSTLSNTKVMPLKPVRPPDSFAYSAELDTHPVRQIFTDSIPFDSLR